MHPDDRDGTSGEPPGSSGLAGLRLLFVDDDPTQRAVIGALLRRHLGHLRVASSAIEALRILERDPYDAVVSDIRMPGLDGLGFYRRAIELAPALEGRFVFLSGSLDDLELSAEVDRTGCPSVPKPFRSSDLLVRLRRVVEGEATRTEPPGACGSHHP